VNAVPLYENGSVIGLFNIGRDITEHEKAEEALRKNEEKYRTLVETMNEGLTVLDENGRWTYVNDKFCYMLGYFSGEFVGHSVFEFLDETNQKILEDQLNKGRKGEYTSYEIEWVRKDGTNIPTIVSPKPIFDSEGRFKGSLAIVTDITEQKRNELALRESENQLRYLSSKLLTIQEQERKRISAELHDELGQALAVMKLRLKSIERGLSKNQTAIRDECNSTLQYINEVIENVRRLSRDLSPSILEDLGLSSALRWMLDEFTKVYHIDVTLEMAEIDHLFSRKAQVILYRIFQEALTNIGKHAQATRVSIVIKKDEDKISFSVEDDGKGFDLSRAARRDMTPKGIGLATMNERVRMLGGSLHLMSQKTGGTRITFTVPPDGGNAE
jgi:two-component system sensor histidine kinase UhpB